MTALVTKHLPLVAGAPDGIKKLRALILDLAIRGKLVPQNPADAPATELLITAGKARAQRKNARKAGAESDLSSFDGSQLAALPTGWVWTTLSDVAQINPRNSVEDNVTVSFVPMAMIGTRFDSGHEHELRTWGEVKQGFTHFAEGDIGVAKITPCFENSKACVFSGLSNGVGAGTTELHVVRPLAQTLAPRYVLAYLKSPWFLSIGETKMTGTAGQKRLPKDFVERHPFPIPPLAEQHRIVAKVDELMALCDRLEADQADAEAAHAQLVQALLDSLTQATDAADFRASWQRLSEHFHTLFTTEASIDALKQAVLQLAVMGKLVPQDERFGSTSDLVEELRSHWAGAKRHRKIGLLNEPISRDRFPLPASWRWLPFGFLGDTRLGKMLDVRKNTGQLKPYLRNTNVQWRRFDLDDLKALRLEPHELDEFRLIKGDLLVCEGGEPGRCAIWAEQSQEMYFQKALHRVRPLLGTLPEYLQICLEADCANGSLSKVFTGATIKHLTGEKLERYAVPIPSPAEQHRIVAKVDELMALCDQLKSQLADARQQHGQLATVLVEQAVA